MKPPHGILCAWLTALCACAASAQWVQTNGPFGGAILCLEKIGNDILSGTSKAGVFRSSDNGQHWKQAHNGNIFNNNPINALTVSGTDIYAVFFQGVYHGIANDLSWTMINSGLSNYVECLLVKDSCLFAGTYFNGIFISKNNGKNWVACNNGLFSGDSSLPCVKTLATDGTTIYAGTRGKGIFVSMDGGETWTAQNTGLVDNYVSCIAIHGDTVIAVADKGIYLSMHNGIWTDITPAPKPSKSAGFYSIAANASAIYIGIDSCRIAKSVDNGSTWNVSRIPIPFSQAVINSLLIKNDSLYAGTSCGLYVSAVNPQAWVNYDSGLNAASIPSLIVRDSGLFASEFRSRRRRGPRRRDSVARRRQGHHRPGVQLL